MTQHFASLGPCLDGGGFVLEEPMSDRASLFPPSVCLMAQHSQRATGVPACVTLAQWALESDYGTALSGHNNPFGIKGQPGRLCWTWEVVGGKYQHVQAYFKDFATLEEAFAAHGRMLVRKDGYYTAALPYLKDWRKFIEHMAPVYATDPHYAAKLVHIIEANSLQGFDLPGT